MIVSYDIDGVLAEQPPPSNKKWGKMKGDERKNRKNFLLSWYMEAKPLLNPKEQTFHAISARKNEETILKITNYWLKKYYPDRVLSFHLLNTSRNIENVVEFKANTILRLNVKRHYEDNKTVLKGLKKQLPSFIELYFWEKGMAEPILYE